MRDSIIVDMKYADLDIINGQYGVERHHCLGGPNRKKADEDGLWVPLTPEHHRTGKTSAHQSTEVQKLLQIIAQLSYELNEVSQGLTVDEARKKFFDRYRKFYIRKGSDKSGRETYIGIYVCRRRSGKNRQSVGKDF